MDLWPAQDLRGLTLGNDRTVIQNGERVAGRADERDIMINQQNTDAGV